MGSIETPSSLANYSIPEETKALLENGILKNPKISRSLPLGTSEFASHIKFTGNNLPSIPINWRFAESVSALKGLEACLVAELVKRKYKTDVPSATINTDHAQLFFMSPAISTLAGKPTIAHPEHGRAIFGVVGAEDLVPNYDVHNPKRSAYRAAATNIYQTKDGKWFHTHASLNADHTLAAMGLPPYPENPALNTDLDVSRQLIADRVKQFDSAELQKLMSDQYKQAGVIVNSVDQFRKSEHGQANSQVGLFEVQHVDVPSHQPSWWPDDPTTNTSRPLAGLKVVDLCRIIAAPAATRGLAELGASVMRVTSPNLPDFSILHLDLNWGKWNCSIDLKDPSGVQTLKALIMDADVVVQGYRPGVLDKYGFGQQDIVDLVRDRDRGIISAREDCYGWTGPWAYRSGWQQISDAVCGVSHRFGQAMGLAGDEPVTPVFPNSDYMTGIAGVCGVLSALIQRAEKGGSYKVDLALNYYSQWLTDSCGEYPEDVWNDVWNRNGRRVFRAWDNMGVTVPAYIDMIRENSRDVLFNPDFFVERETKALDVTLRSVKPVIRFDDDLVRLGFNVGTRGNGLDAARWPDDLTTEVVK